MMVKRFTPKTTGLRKLGDDLKDESLDEKRRREIAEGVRVPVQKKTFGVYPTTGNLSLDDFQKEDDRK